MVGQSCRSAQILRRNLLDGLAKHHTRGLKAPLIEDAAPLIGGAVSPCRARRMGIFAHCPGHCNPCGRSLDFPQVLLLVLGLGMKFLDLTLPTPAANLACDEALLDACDDQAGG